MNVQVTCKRIYGQSVPVSLAELAPDGIFIVSQGIIIFANPAFARMLGYPDPTQLQEREAFEVVHPDHRDRIKTMISRLGQDSGKLSLESGKLLRLDGSVVDTEMTMASIDLDGSRAAVIFVKKVTDHKRVEAAVKLLNGIAIDAIGRLRVEGDLQEREERMRLALEAGKMGVWDWDVRSNTVKWSKEHFEVFGMEPFTADPEYSTWAERVHPDDLPYAEAVMIKAIEDQVEYHAKYRIVWPDGSIHWVVARGRPIYDEAGQCIRVMGWATDITECWQTLEALHESETRNRAILKAIPDLIFVTNREGIYLDFHIKDPCDPLVPPEQFIGKSMWDVLPQDLAEAFARCFEQAANSGEASILEYSLPLRGGIGHYEARVVSCDDDRVLTIVRDISERRRAEEALRESQERYAQATAAGGVGVWDWNLETNEIYIDPPLKAALGFEEHEIRNHIDDWMRRLHPEDTDRVMAEVAHHLEGRLPYYQVERRMLRKDGSVCWFLARGSTIRRADGRPYRLVGTETDITDRKKAEEALQQALAEVERLKNQLQAENIYLQEEILSEYNFGEILGQSEALQQVLRKALQVAPTDTTVLILGETGTGKELFAHAIHSLSLRKDRSLVKVNCATLPAHLIESELFGHEKGAFTGAVSFRAGRFEIADGATIFLDEIGELPLDLQAKLLRVLQEGEFERLGSSRTIKVDVRVIAATNRDLEAAVRQGTFRADLFYRLNVFPLSIPPLRERLEDIPLFVSYFVSKACQKLGREIGIIQPEVIELLRDYHWPGNVRELWNVIERAVITNRGGRLQLADALGVFRLEETAANSHEAHRIEGVGPNGMGTLAEVERDYITKVLEKTYWRVEGRHGAAEILGLRPNTLRYRMHKLGIQRPKRED